MSKKRWISVAAAMVAAVAVMCVFYFPRQAAKVLDLQEQMPVSIHATVNRAAESVADAEKYSTADAQKVADAVTCLRELRVRYLNNSSVTTYRSQETAWITVVYDDGSQRRIFFAPDGKLRYDDKNYGSVDAAPLKELMAQIKNWEAAQ